MPIYEYQCKKCGQSFEEIITNNEKPLCPNCCSLDTEQHLSLPCLHIESGSPISGFSSRQSSCSGCSGRSCSTCH